MSAPSTQLTLPSCLQRHFLCRLVFQQYTTQIPSGRHSAKSLITYCPWTSCMCSANLENRKIMCHRKFKKYLVEFWFCFVSLNEISDTRYNDYWLTNIAVEWSIMQCWNTPPSLGDLQSLWSLPVGLRSSNKNLKSAWFRGRPFSILNVSACWNYLPANIITQGTVGAFKCRHHPYASRIQPDYLYYFISPARTGYNLIN